MDDERFSSKNNGASQQQQLYSQPPQQQNSTPIINKMSGPRSASGKTSSSTTNKGSEPRPTFEVISPDKLFSLYEQRKGTQYFIPEGFEPVLIPTNNGTQVQPANLLLTNGRGNNSNNGNNRHNVKNNNQLLIQQKQLLMYQQQKVLQQQQQFQNQQNQHHQQSATVDDADLVSATPKFPSLVLTQRATGTTSRGGSVSKAAKPKKPPRPPNAFILYRRLKQPEIVAANEGITNNEVSKQVGEMWHKESMEEKMKFQRMADTAKMEHMKKYPEYKYRPRRPHEKRRRTKRPSTTTTAVTSNGNSNNNNSTATPSSTTATVISSTTTTALMGPSNDNLMAFTQSPMMNNEEIINTFDINYDNDLQRRASIETTVSSISESGPLDCFGEFSRRSSFSSTIDNDMSVLFGMNTSSNSPSSIALASPMESAQLAVSPNVNNALLPPDCFEAAFEQYNMMDVVSPGEESGVPTFEFLGYPTANNYPGGGPFDFLPLDFTAFMTNDQLLCE